MNRNWYNAFVHAFNDEKEIVEIHNPDYAAWGAGIYANPYYIHIELVETGDNIKFARSVNNQAYYVAYKLKQYNLKPSRANSNKTGSVWFHDEVSKWLGGTNHSDPSGYFKKHGYSFAKFYELVERHYKAIPDFWVSSTRYDYHSNNKVKTKVVDLRYLESLKERKIYAYDDKGVQTSYRINTYHNNGNISYQAIYDYKIRNKNERYTSLKTLSNFNNQGVRISLTRYDYKTNGKTKLKRDYTYNSNKKVKSRKTTAYTERRISGVLKNYRSSYETVSYNDKGNKTSAYKYIYNKLGQARTNNYGKAKRHQYFYNNGKLVRRLTRDYDAFNKLKKKVHYKYY